MKNQQTVLKELLEQAKIPALSIGWCQKGSSHVVAFGSTDTSAPQSVDTSTLFQAASLSKPVSAAIVLDLVEQGKWNLKKPLCEYAPFGSPELQRHPHYKIVTTGMIIGQCSGLPNWFEGGVEKFIATPNTQFTYSGVALDFLKQVIEEQLQEKWENLTQDFFKKVGMTTSTFKQVPASHLRETQGITVASAHKADGTALPNASVDSSEIPAGSLLTTPQDYIAFLQYCFKNDSLKSTLLKGTLSSLPPMTSETQHVQWGLGMGVYNDSQLEKTVAFHWGNNTGTNAFCAMDMKTGDCIVSFANSENGPKLFQQIAKPVVGDLAPLFQWLDDWCNFRDATPQPPETTAKLAHCIHSAPGVEITHQFKQDVKQLQNGDVFTTSTSDGKKIL